MFLCRFFFSVVLGGFFCCVFFFFQNLLLLLHPTDTFWTVGKKICISGKFTIINPDQLMDFNGLTKDFKNMFDMLINCCFLLNVFKSTLARCTVTILYICILKQHKKGLFCIELIVTKSHFVVCVPSENPFCIIWVLAFVVKNKKK